MRKPILGLLGALVSGVLTLSFIVPVPAAQAEVSQRRQAVMTPEHLDFRVFDKIPSLETGLTEALPTSADGTVLLSRVEDGSALVRISVFAPRQSGTLSVTGTPALDFVAGHDSSTAVIVPVQGGRIAASSTEPVNARIEVLAHFGTPSNTPGSTNALPVVVNRADSAIERGIAMLKAEDQLVSMVGLGGVPSSDVRAVHLTATINLPTAGTVAVAGQQLDLPSGRSIVTTIATVNEYGELSVNSSAGGTIALDVRGWVAGAGQDMSSANASGGFVPAPVGAWSVGKPTTNDEMQIRMPGLADRTAGVALVSAAATNTSHRSFVNLGVDAQGRSRGIVTDPQSGALPQIEVVEITGDVAPVHVSGAASDVRALLLGDFAGNRSDQAKAVSVTLVAPKTANLAALGTIELSGTLQSASSIDRVEVYGNDQMVGTAAIEHSPQGMTWRIRTGSPVGGDVEFRALAVSRDGGSGEARGITQVVLPSVDDVVLNSQTVVVDADQIIRYTSGEVMFATEPSLKPGDVMVAGVSQNTPEGALLRVTALQKTADGWLVLVDQAALTDAFLQASSESETPILDDDTAILPPSAAPADYEVIDDGVENVSLVGRDIARAESGLIRETSRSGAPFGARNEKTLKASAELAYSFPHSSKKKDVSKASPANKAKAKKSIALEGGFALKAEVTASLGLNVEMNIEVNRQWGIPTPYLEHFKTSVSGGYQYEYQASVSGKAKAQIEKELANLLSAPVTILVGIVPVILVPGVSISLEGAVAGEVSASFSKTFGNAFEYGVQYKRGEWKAIKKVTGTAENSPNSGCLGWGKKAALEGSVSGELGLAVAATVKIYGVVGPEIKVSAALEIEYSPKSSGDGTFKLDSKLAIALSAALGVDAVIQVLGFKIGSKWSFTVGKISLPIWDTSGQAIPMCAPDEDGAGEGGEDDDHLVLIHGTVSNASTTAPIAGAVVTVTDSARKTWTTTSDSAGEYQVRVNAGDLGVRVEAEGYITYTSKVSGRAGEEKLHNVRMSTPLRWEEYRAVLTWGETPWDLDSHFMGLDASGSYHISYRNRQKLDDHTGDLIAELDVDDVSGFGPETTTFTVNDAGDYAFFVHNYSGNDGESALATSGANVTLYKGSAKVGEYRVPAGGPELYWNVFRISGGQVHVANALSDSPFTAGESDRNAELAPPVDRLATLFGSKE